MAVIVPSKKLTETGKSKALIIPKKWAEDKEEVGAVVFDMNSKNDRKLFFDTKEDIIDKTE